MNTYQPLCTVDLPRWAISYLAYGDGSGLEDDEMIMIDEWHQETMDSLKTDFITLEFTSEFSEFTCNPEFGLACDTITTNIWGAINGS